MNKIAVIQLKRIRHLYTKRYKASDQKPCPKLDYQGQAASDFIKDMLTSNNPCMIGRLGKVEMDAILCYLDIIYSGGIIPKSIKYIRDEIGPFWWDNKTKYSMCNNTGFFPANTEYLEKFANTMLRDIQKMDVLGSWGGEDRLANYFSNARIVSLTDLEPYYHSNPWSEVLEGKRVLVIYPYEDSIKKQYKKHSILFDDPRVLPKFELKKKDSNEPVLIS